MSKTWIEFLQSRNASIASNGEVQFAGLSKSLRALVNGETLLCDLSYLGLLEVSGEDAKSFLQGQLTNDLEKVHAQRGQRNAYCTPKGRMLAIFTTLLIGDRFGLLFPNELLESIEKRLRMYVLRAKVKLEASNSIVCFGISGNQAGQLLQENNLSVPESDLGVTESEDIHVLRINDSPERYLVAAPTEKVTALWEQLAKKCNEADGRAWRWLEIQGGLPNVHEGTSEAFTPQMANLDAIDGLNFKKGCYPGQEIVARTRYLGKLKQRMYGFHLDTDDIPDPGTPLYAESFGEQSAGKIVDAVKSPNGGIDLLAVAQIHCVENETLHLGKSDGPELSRKPLPYSVEDSGKEAG